MTNIISLEVVRQERRALQSTYVPYTEVVERILNIPGGRVAIGAIVLLHHIAYLINKGQPTLSYTYLCERIGISRPTLSAHIDELEDKGYLTVRRARKDAKFNRPNYFEIDFTGPLGDAITMLKMPKKPNELGSKEIKLPPVKVVKKLNGNNIYKENIQIIPKGIRRSSAPRFESISDALEHSEKRITRKRAEKVVKATRAGSQLTLAGVKATWAAAMLRHYPTVPPVMFTAKDFAIFKAKIQPLLATCNLSEVFDYMVSSWRSLRESKFIWLRMKGKDVAIAPSLPELMRYWKIFAQAFADSRMAVADNADKGKRTEVEDLQDALAQAKAAKAVAESDATRLRDRAVRAERAAYGARTAAAPRQSLSARQKALDESYNDDTPLPEWK